MQGIQRMDHFTVVTDRLDETRTFYERLGLAVGPRPGVPVPGIWLCAGEHPVLNVVEVALRARPQNAGPLAQAALSTQGDKATQ